MAMSPAADAFNLLPHGPPDNHCRAAEYTAITQPAALSIRTAPRRVCPEATTQLRPAPLALYSAWSADLSTSSGLRCSAWRSATPMLTVTDTLDAPLPARRCRPCWSSLGRSGLR